MPRLRRIAPVARLLLAVPLAGCLAAPVDRPASGVAGVVTLPAAWLRHGGPAGTCQAAPDGRPLELAERGIGGTGPLQPKAPPAQPGTPEPTGVAAIITGFGSVCLAGLEVGLAPDLAVSDDGAPAAETALRAGQRAALTVRWQDGRPVTQAIAVRHEVVGPIDSLGPNGRLVVAGQAVQLVAGGWGEAPHRVGAWIAVSGLHAPDGLILASRVDAAPAGTVLLRGRLSGGPGHWRMGQLALDLPGPADALAGPLILRGQLYGGVLQVTTWQQDRLEADPAGYFGPSVHRYAIQALVTGQGHGLAAYDFKLPLPRNLPLPRSVVPAIVGFERVGDAVSTPSMTDQDAGGMTAAGDQHGPGEGAGPPARGGMGGPRGGP
ncbi:hypothetical protein Acid7E03_11490 [Acidisoma sp. 7E03]